MAKICISKDQAEKIKSAIRNGEISIEKLFSMSSEERIDLISKYVSNYEVAKMTTSTLEKAYLSPNQKLAMRNWIFKNIAQAKPLYVGVSLEQSAEMAKNLNIRELKNMTSEERIKALSRFVGEKTAINLNDRFERLKKSGNIANWEERTLGTDKIRKDKKIKGSLAKLENLDDLGVLTPEDLNGFMQSFVETELGIDITLEESQKLSELVNDQRDAYDKLVESGDWTANNEKAVIDYFDKRKTLEEYSDTLMPKGATNVANNIINYFRASILASPRILRNSFLYQAIPGIERTITKRLVSGNFNTEDLKSNVIEKIRSKMSGVKIDKESVDFIKRQTAMAVKIYHKTGYDISRMGTLEEGYRYFGEEVGKITGTSLFSKFGRVVNLAPKWFAGGTDMLFANVGRADTSTMLSKEIAKMEEIKGKLPEGVNKEQRAYQILEDSYSFDPRTKQGQIVREAGIMDAHMMNGTQQEWWSDMILKFRKGLTIKNVNFGKALIPFAKIANVVMATGVKTASGYGLAQGLYQINQASRITDPTSRIIKMRQGVSNLIRYSSFMAAALLLTTFLDDDDYIGAWDTVSIKEYQLARGRNAGTNYVRVGGKWIPLRFLPLINIPISAIMTARQARSRGENPEMGYFVGIVGQVLDSPGISESKNIIDKISNAIKQDNLNDMASSLGLDAKGLLDWSKVRMIPSILSYDVYNALYPADSKYDFMGREIQKGGIFKDDKSNEITLEFNRLNNSGNMPTTSDPRGNYVNELKEKLGEEEYQKLLSELKKVYAEEISRFIDSSKYKYLDNDEDKKKEINKIRQEEVLDKLEYKNKWL